MKGNFWIRLLTSLPIILLLLYYLPFLGICLLLFRYFFSRLKMRFFTSFFLLVFGLVLLIPNGILMISRLIEKDIVKSLYLTDVVNSLFYQDSVIGYAKLLLTLGTLFSLFSALLSRIFNRGKSLVRAIFKDQEKKRLEIFEKNDMLIKERQEKARNTHVVICPYCGADLMLTESTGTCKYCRRKIGVAARK